MGKKYLETTTVTKGIISRICKEFSKLEHKNQTSPNKKWKKRYKEVFCKEVYAEVY